MTEGRVGQLFDEPRADQQRKVFLMSMSVDSVFNLRQASNLQGNLADIRRTPLPRALFGCDMSRCSRAEICN